MHAACSPGARRKKETDEIVLSDEAYLTKASVADERLARPAGPRDRSSELR